MAVQTDRSEIERVNQWLMHMERDSNWLEVENRPWSNENSRWSHSQCQGYDFAHHDPRVKMRFFWNENEQLLSGSIHWDNRTEGPPGGSHGASIMLVFDEILAYPVWRGGEPAFTANVNLDLKKMIPFNQAAIFEAKIISRERRKRKIEAHIFNYDKSITYASGIGLWIVADGMAATMAVHEHTMKNDQKRLESNDRVLRFPLAPGAESNVNKAGMLTIDAHRYRPLTPPDQSNSLTLFQPQTEDGLVQDFFTYDKTINTHNYPANRAEKDDEIGTFYPNQALKSKL